MTSDGLQAPDLSERVERLERGVRLVKVVGVVLLVGAVVASRYMPRGKTIEGQYLLLRDENGHERVLLTANSSAASVNLLDESGKLQAGLSTENNDPKLTIFDSKEQKRIAIGMLDDSPTLIFENASGKPALMLRQEGETAGFALLDPEGHVLWSAPKIPDERK
jgi:hypothetical protein